FILITLVRSPHRWHVFCFFHDLAPPETYTLSLHDALPISRAFSLRYLAIAPSTILATMSAGLPDSAAFSVAIARSRAMISGSRRSEEHTSELQSPYDLVCRLLLEKKNKKQPRTKNTKTIDV